MLLETQTMTTNGVAYQPMTFGATGVRRIDGLQPTDNWVWGMDNLSFTAANAAVPEPATWTMLIGGFGMIGSALRRRAATIAVA